MAHDDHAVGHLTARKIEELVDMRLLRRSIYTRRFRGNGRMRYLFSDRSWRNRLRRPVG